TVLNDTAGTVVDSYIIDAWGNTRSQNVSISNPFVYTSRESAEAGLTFYRARYYGSTIGRFLSEDTMWRSKSFYTYVSNKPIAFTDAYGLYMPGDIVCRHASGSSWSGADVVLVTGDNRPGVEDLTTAKVEVATYGHNRNASKDEIEGCLHHGNPGIAARAVAGSTQDPYQPFYSLNSKMADGAMVSTITSASTLPNPRDSLSAFLAEVDARIKSWNEDDDTHCYYGKYQCSNFVYFLLTKKKGTAETPATFCGP